EELRKKISLFAQGSTRYNLPKQQMFEKLFISYPESLSAQRRIAAILASADKVIAATQKLIAKYKQMKQGMMEELFNEQCTMNNVQWKKVRLEECLTIGNGQDYKHLQSGEIPVYGTGGVMTYVDDYLYDGETVCIGRKGTINKPIYHTGKIWTVDTLFYTHSFVGVVPLFIYYIFCNVDWNKYNEATGVPSLSKETIYKIEISIPDLAEQCRIATILSGIDAKIATEEKVLEKYEKVKKGLMERLLNEQCTMNN
ncbi:MAG: restriction endonuclease subunit S, partial [Salinivirgaceae bacterium]|nr:restriction endonuclease subunit S [Salinivirgaceae bacterium]